MPSPKQLRAQADLMELEEELVKAKASDKTGDKKLVEIKHAVRKTRQEFRTLRQAEEEAEAAT